MITSHAKRVATSGSGIRKMFDLAQQMRAEGKKPIDLSLGNPDIKPPTEYFDAAGQVLSKSRHSPENHSAYMPNAGYSETRARVAQDLTSTFGVKFTNQDIIMTAGAANGLDVLLMTLIEPAIDHSGIAPKVRAGIMGQKGDLTLDEVIIIAPYFVEYSNYIRNNQGTPVSVHANGNFGLNISAIERAISPRTKAVIINSPNNPSGAIYTEKELADLADILNEKNTEFGTTIACIEDAPYKDIVFSGHEFISMLSYYPNTFHVFSFSKSRSIPAERIGFIAVSPEIELSDEDKATLSQALVSNLRTRVVNSPAFQQRIIQSIGCCLLADVKKYEDRATKLANTLTKLGFKLHMPKGTFYLFPEIPDYFTNPADFMEVAHSGNEPLLYVPGEYFGGEQYSRHIRLGVCTDDANIDRACTKLDQMCDAAKTLVRSRS